MGKSLNSMVVENEVSSTMIKEMATGSLQKSESEHDREHESRKRKVTFDIQEYPIEGVGAGNHPPFHHDDSEDDEMAGTTSDERYNTAYNRVPNPSELDDDTLYALLNEARRRTERASIYASRRDTGKMQRPSQASLFLDSVGGQTFHHPSQLFNSHHVSSRTHTGSSAAQGFLWL